MGLSIEWESYDDRGRRRAKPPASTVHGWLMKWRGTFSGDEALRKQGMREMREAKAVRAYRQQKGGGRKKSSGSGIGLSFLRRGPSSVKRSPSKSKSNRSSSDARQRNQSSSQPISRSSTRSRHQPSQSRQIVPHPTHHRHNSTRQNSGHRNSPAPPPKRPHRSRTTPLPQQSPKPTPKRANTSKR
ncbi:hypothetical protein OE88DRAFT_1804302 [Heliocybe sulcata]|uniref:Uncharacterized protein n=1 Tax=Heliocybe sulcata TaxID=5364 RepID=A0A5C3NG43_9AGAM|nr:hypothetical protein OE88DRAFT_1804302 [Heliocybe sulcata]